MNLLRLFFLFALVTFGGASLADTERVGIIVMHGKGGAPNKHVADLATALERRGMLVANLDMPWSGRRQYDVPVAAAEQEVANALAGLRARGAGRLFVAGHSQGGVFALHLGGTALPLDGIIAIAPGGNVGAPVFREKLAEAIGQARDAVAQGKGTEKLRLADFESSRGVFPVIAEPASYLTWFEPEGAMNQVRAARALRADMPVLFIAPTRDYPGLLRVKDEMFGMLPKHPLTRLYEPAASHMEAPTASADEIERWIAGTR